MSNPLNLDRRALLGAVPAVAVAAAVPAIAAVTTDRSAWEAALANLREADAWHKRAIDALGAAEDRYFKTKPGEPAGYGWTLPGELEDGTADRYNARQALLQEQIEAADAEARRVSGLDAADDEEGRSCNASAEAVDAVIATPAPDLAAVAHKIELAAARGMEASELLPLLADLTRMEA